MSSDDHSARDFESLSDREARLRAILETSVEGIITIDERGLIESMNLSAEQMFGYSEAAVLGKNVTLLMPPPYSEDHDAYIAKYLQTGEKKIIGIGRNVLGRRSDGATFPMHLSVSEVRLSRGRFFTGFVYDLSEHVATETKALRLGRILEDSLNEIYMFDARTLKLLTVNRGARENLGYSMEELLEMTPLHFKTEFTPEQFDAILLPLRDRQVRVVEFETIHQRKDGSRYPVEVRLQLDPRSDDPVFVAIVSDISERKKFQQELEGLVGERTRQLEAAQEELIRKERLATLGKLAGGVAHEIRNPLGVIRNAAYFLQQASNDTDEDVRESFNEIERALNSSNHIVGELLDYARDPQPNHTAFSADEALANALAAFRVPQSIHLVKESQPGLDCIGDQGQIERILFNLLNNAIQAMPHGGTLAIDCRGAENTVVFEIADTGVGIPSEQLSQIFDPLFTRKAKGIGLGLAISQRYADLNRAAIHVESAPGQGSTFRLTLPRVLEPGKAD
ncbi:PAS domain-containing sensor histidine kinase [Lignipirellula cremea]|nr:PAS domain-containing sensor histidine kinase [Lignipirellula cremea]